MKQLTVASVADIDRLESLVNAAAVNSLARIRDELPGALDLAMLARLRFEQVGCDPLDSQRALNFVEQLNQSFTYLATIEGARHLLSFHPEHAPFRLNLGTAPGSDIASTNGEVIAETFAATHPDSNDKLRKDVAKVLATPAKHRYVFYLSPVEAKLAPRGVTVMRLVHPSLRGLQRYGS